MKLTMEKQWIKISKNPSLILGGKNQTEVDTQIPNLLLDYAEIAQHFSGSHSSFKNEGIITAMSS